MSKALPIDEFALDFLRSLDLSKTSPNVQPRQKVAEDDGDSEEDDLKVINEQVLLNLVGGCILVGPGCLWCKLRMLRLPFMKCVYSNECKAEYAQGIISASLGRNVQRIVIFQSVFRVFI
jgi:hypothetical protein